MRRGEHRLPQAASIDAQVLLMMFRAVEGNNYCQHCRSISRGVISPCCQHYAHQPSIIAVLFGHDHHCIATACMRHGCLSVPAALALLLACLSVCVTSSPSANRSSPFETKVFFCFVWGGVSSWAGELGCDSWAHVDEAPPRGRRATVRRLGLQRLVLRDLGGEGCEQ